MEEVFDVGRHLKTLKIQCHQPVHDIIRHLSSEHISNKHSFLVCGKLQLWTLSATYEAMTSSIGVMVSFCLTNAVDLSHAKCGVKQVSRGTIVPLK